MFIVHVSVSLTFCHGAEKHPRYQGCIYFWTCTILWLPLSILSIYETYCSSWLPNVLKSTHGYLFLNYLVINRPVTPTWNLFLFILLNEKCWNAPMGIYFWTCTNRPVTPTWNLFLFILPNEKCWKAPMGIYFWTCTVINRRHETYVHLDCRTHDLFLITFELRSVAVKIWNRSSVTHFWFTNIWITRAYNHIWNRICLLFIWGVDKYPWLSIYFLIVTCPSCEAKYTLRWNKCLTYCIHIL